MKILVFTTYHVLYLLLEWVSVLGMVAVGMSRSTINTPTIGFYFIMAVLILSPIIFYLNYQKCKVKCILIAGSLPVLSYGLLMIYHFIIYR